MNFDFREKVLEDYWVETYGSVTKAIFKKGNKLVSDTIEELYAEYTGGVVMNATGYDILIDDEIRDEIKSTMSILRNGNMRIGGLSHKEGKCDYIVIIDLIHNRTFRIPADIFFSEADQTISTTKTSTSHEFYWSGSYNKNDNLKPENTNFLLKYEVK
jgi:hypothetical protein